jgi:hypothetical protein
MKRSERPDSIRKFYVNATLSLDLTTVNYSADYIRFYHLRVYDRINAPMGKRFSVFFTYFLMLVQKIRLLLRWKPIRASSSDKHR